jgi:hypothetical protein
MANLSGANLLSLIRLRNDLTSRGALNIAAKDRPGVKLYSIDICMQHVCVAVWGSS